MNLYSFKLFKFELVEAAPGSEVPQRRSGHRVVCNSKYLYVFGGYNPTAPNNGYQELWEYNFCSKKWKKRNTNENFPEAVISSCVLRRRDKLLIFGGTAVPFAFKCSNKLHSIKLTEDLRITTLIVNGKGPKPQYGQSIVMHKNVLYAIGGTDGFLYNCDIHRINLNKTPRTWKTLYSKKAANTDEDPSYQPVGRYRHEVAFDGKNIYVIGGGTAIHSYDLIEIPVFNIQRRKWKKMKTKGDTKATPEYPDARRCHDIVQVKTDNDIHIFLIGGYQNNKIAFNDLWRLELSNLKWTLISKDVLPKAPYFHSMALTREGKLYLFGGMEGGNVLVRNNKMYSMWIRVPKLAEIAWEAVLYYFPNIRPNDRFNGLELPTVFSSRLE